MAPLDPAQRERCPCCGYPTLGSRSAYEICELYAWKDDGQGEAQADEVWGGPNHGYSHSQARRNFRRFLVMYEPDGDRRIGGPDSERTRDTKRRLMLAFDRLESAPPSERPAVIAEIQRQERRLDQELREWLRAHDAAVIRSRLSSASLEQE